MSKHFVLSALVTAATVFSACAAPAFKSYKEARDTGIKAYRAKKYADMREAYSAAKKLTSSQSQIWDAVYWETRACRQLQKWDDAIKILDDYIKTNPPADRLASANFVKGLVFTSKGDDAQAIKNFEAALNSGKLSAGEKSQNTNNLISRYYAAKAYDKCEALAQKAYADTKYDYRPEAAYTMANCLIRKKQYEEAVKLLTEALELQQSNNTKSMLSFILAKSLDALKKQDEANKHYKFVAENAKRYWRGKESARILKARGVK